MALLIAAGCASGCQERSDHAVLTVDAAAALADRPVHLTISGLASGDTVTVSADAVDGRWTPWHSQANFRADRRGAVDLDHARPISGAYSGVDGMGLFWSMNAAAGDPDRPSFDPPRPEGQPSYPVRISVTAHGRRLAERTLTRQWIGSGVTRQNLTVDHDGIVAELFLPPAGTARHPAVLIFGGSEGGNVGVYEAALLASHGYPALSLAYFAEPGLPTTLQNIPLSYFTRAAHTLAGEPGVDPSHLVVQGASRGSEVALLLGQYEPDLVHGVILYAPSNVVNAGIPSGTAWTRNGRPVDQGLIPVDHVNGPILAIAGVQDVLWPSAPSSRQLMTELDLDHDRFPHAALIYPGAGHAVGAFPTFRGPSRPPTPPPACRSTSAAAAPPTPPRRNRAGRKSSPFWPTSPTEGFSVRANIGGLFLFRRDRSSRSGPACPLPAMVVGDRSWPALLPDAIRSMTFAEGSELPNWQMGPSYSEQPSSSEGRKSWRCEEAFYRAFFERFPRWPPDCSSRVRSSVWGPRRRPRPAGRPCT